VSTLRFRDRSESAGERRRDKIDGSSDVDVDADPLDDSLELDGQVDSAITALRLQSTAQCTQTRGDHVSFPRDSSPLFSHYSFSLQLPIIPKEIPK